MNEPPLYSGALYGDPLIFWEYRTRRFFIRFLHSEVSLPRNIKTHEEVAFLLSPCVIFLLGGLQVILAVIWSLGRPQTGQITASSNELTLKL